MNIFSKDDAFIGTNGINESISVKKIFELANDIRLKLEKQGYLLDKYISLILESANVTLVFEAATDGFEAGSVLRRLCRAIVDGEVSEEEHSFYETAKQKIAEIPLPYQEKITRVDICFAMLAEEYLSFVLDEFIKEQQDKLRAGLDIIYLKELYNHISAIVGEDILDSLNLMLKQRFLKVLSIHAFIQGFTNDLLYCLIHRDCETNKQVFQLLEN
ncbi:MAG: hypothetical protein BWY15_02047 [Firmicutes bacterium ADurb.Bin193]|nr:MAG: hypothetical protein BWY15_02047 [Firmicutes bacterium ADurb.Bin193]